MVGDDRIEQAVEALARDLPPDEQDGVESTVRLVLETIAADGPVAVFPGGEVRRVERHVVAGEPSAAHAGLPRMVAMYRPVEEDDA